MKWRNIFVGRLLDDNVIFINFSMNPWWNQSYLGGGFEYFVFSSLPGEMIQFDEHIFQLGWNHQLDILRFMSRSCGLAMPIAQKSFSKPPEQ